MNQKAICGIDGLEDDAVALLHEIDARAGLDAKPAADARRHSQPAFGGNFGRVQLVHRFA